MDGCRFLKCSDGGFLAREARPAVEVVRYRGKGIAGADQRRARQGMQVGHLSAPIRRGADQFGVTAIHPADTDIQLFSGSASSGDEVVSHNHVGQRQVCGEPPFIAAGRIVAYQDEGVVDHLPAVCPAKLAVIEIDNEALG